MAVEYYEMESMRGDVMKKNRTFLVIIVIFLLWAAFLIFGTKESGESYIEGVVSSIDETSIRLIPDEIYLEEFPKLSGEVLIIKSEVFKSRSFDGINKGDRLRIIFTDIDGKTGQPENIMDVYQVGEDTNAP
ncbi:MAG TPA: hypothetical protein IAB10_03140 [Candidatus Avilachnospira avistercoris]|nr:hypothetical protein [Candidatus Avilachnospira avistercoris]